MAFKSKTYRDYWPATLIFSIAGILVYIYLHFGIYGSFPNNDENIDELILSFLIGGVSGFSFKFSAFKLNNIINWKKNFAIRFFLGVFVHSFLLILTTIIFIYFYVNLIQGQNINYFLETLNDTPLKLIIILSFLVFLVEIIDFSVFSFDNYAKVQIEIQQQHRNQLNLQFDALKSQLSPHYLFNSLNTISSLVYKDIRIAERFIRELTENFRYILSTNNRRLVSVEEELTMAKSYAYLMEIRFENCFELITNIPESNYNYKLPSLSLQMLIENALKHNLLSEEEPLKVKIEIENNRLKVSNLFKPKSSHVTIDNQLLKKPLRSDSLSLGLNNIKKRYSYFTEKNVEVKRDKYFSVYLPLISKEDEG